jgi:hypothetical protein
VVGEEEVEEKEFGVNQVFGIDVFVSTGDGVPKIVSYWLSLFSRFLVGDEIDRV